MFRKMVAASLMLALISSWCLPHGRAYAGVEWSVGKQLNLDATPLDIAASADGQWLYVLAPGEVLIYSLTEEKAIIRIPTEGAFDSMAYSPKENALILSNSATKEVKVIRLEILHEFSLSGLPFKGPENARVVIAVFSDYQ